MLKCVPFTRLLATGATARRAARATTAMDAPTMVELFPVNGLDRSLHAPVLVGLLLLTLFAETLGWTYAGLVVPGYFASVMLAAPATAALVLTEAVVTYAVAGLLGRWLPRTGVWSSAFGRERFFLLIVIGLGVRLALEANLLPFLEGKLQLPHSRELHSLGLVLVPLLANMFWNAGFIQSFPRVLLLSGLTYLFVDCILLRYTNFTISRFEVANESVSLAFLEAPHAQFILLIGALLAARANVLYGWDYNGILVPALLSVAWYQPTKLATTVIEALVVYGCARGLAALPPLSGVLIVGTRRTLLAFLVGFALKWIAGSTMMRLDPSVHMVDFLGFGYLLPTLLAVKMWNRNAIGTVIVPTVQVSAVAFVVGNLAGYGLASFATTTTAQADVAPLPAVQHDVAFELMLGQTAPAPSILSADLAARSRLSREAVDRLLEGQPFDQALLQRAAQLDVRLVQTRDAAAGEHLVIRPRTRDPDADRAAPRAAVRMRPRQAAPWLVVAVVDRVGSPVIAAATEVARVLDARGLVLQSAAGPSADYDAAVAEELAAQLQTTHVLRVVIGADAELDAVGELPAALDMRELKELLRTEPALNWREHRAAASPLGNATVLRLPPQVAELLGARVLQSPDPVSWPSGTAVALGDKLEALTSVRPFAFESPSIEELRLFRARIAPAFLALTDSSRPGLWERALAHRLRYRFARIGDSERPAEGWALFEPSSPSRRGNATWIRRVGPALQREGGLLIEAPAIRWEIGTFRAALMMLSGLQAEGLLIPGALPNAAYDGRADVRTRRGVRAFYHAIHQSWLDAGGHGLSIHGIAAERDVGEDVVLSLGRELPDARALPAWSARVTDFLVGNGLRPALVDGSLELAPFEGSHDPAAGYAARFAPDTMLLMWLSPRLRAHMVSMQEDEVIGRRLSLAGVPIARTKASERALTLLECLSAPAGSNAGPAAASCPARRASPACDAEDVAARFEAYTESRNPHTLHAALREAQRCHLELIEDSENDLLWALLADRRQGFLVPLRGGPARRSPLPCSDRASLRSLLSAGLASARLQGAP